MVRPSFGRAPFGRKMALLSGQLSQVVGGPWLIACWPLASWFKAMNSDQEYASNPHWRDGTRSLSLLARILGTRGIVVPFVILKSRPAHCAIVQFCWSVDVCAKVLVAHKFVRTQAVEKKMRIGSSGFLKSCLQESAHKIGLQCMDSYMSQTPNLWDIGCDQCATRTRFLVQR